MSKLTQIGSNQDILHSYGLNIDTVTWEDTGRNKNSCMGPNISDMTLVVRRDDRSGGSTNDLGVATNLAPIIRKPNFSDVTHDVPIDAFKLLVRKQVTDLKTVLSGMNLLLDRDSVILSSSQCCLLPSSKNGVEFAVQLFNYQSYDLDPAVLTILATKDGTSMQTLTSNRVKLFFNDKGEARWFKAEPLETVREREKAEKTRVDSFKEMTAVEKLNNTIMVIQVPLKQKQRAVSRGEGCSAYSGCSGPTLLSATDCRGGMDMAQISLGSSAGDYPSLDRFKLERDDRFPIRCTFQYYRVTDSDLITEKKVIDIKEQLDQIEKLSKASGSLVVSSTERLTEHTASGSSESVSSNESTSKLWNGQQLGAFN